MENPVRVFVASTPAEWLPMKVLEFSIRETTSLPVEVSAIYTFNRQIPMPREVNNRPRTPFSFQRFLIPELCDFSGKAIYMDADMQVFHDIKNLWNQDFNDCDLQTVQEGSNGRKGQFSVMLLDCQALKWNVDRIVDDLNAGKMSYSNLMYDMCVAKTIGRDISAQWNSLEQYDKEKTNLLHYTDMKSQPWVSTSNPYGDIWVACLRRALNDGFISREELLKEIDAGHIRPSLLVQIDENVGDAFRLTSANKALDDKFIAPYHSLKCGAASPWLSFRFAAKMVLVRIYYRSSLHKYFSRFLRMVNN